MLESLFASSNYQAAKTLMDVTAQRHQVLASNLANVDTPGYERKDIAPSFKTELQRSIAARDTEAIQQMGEVSFAKETGLKATRPDGNNVRLDRELMLINRNALQYEASTQFVSGTFDRLKTAITGRTS